MASPKEQRSLFGEILDWMLAPLLLLWPMSLGLTGVVAQEIANRPYDRDLGESTWLLARQVQIIPGPARGDLARVSVQAARALELLRFDDTDKVYFQVLGVRGEFLFGDRDLPVPEGSLPEVGEVQFRSDQMLDEPVRVATLLLPIPGEPEDRGVMVQYAETLGKRSRLTTEIIKGVILPQFVILPLAVLLVWLALAKGIKPLNELQQRIRQRESGDLSPIDGREAPEEVAPLVASINDLLQRLDQSLSVQKHFLADAAHQLKTPLAGLRMQAELAVREIDAGQRDPLALKAALNQISLSSQRAAHSVNQLLAMARAEDQQQALRTQPVDLAQIVQDAMLDLFTKAQDKGIDIGYEGADPGAATAMVGQPVLLGELVRNLLDNALQYTPVGGSVTARVLPDPFGQVLVLQVEDSGPGIPEAERELIFQPFYRALGTGVDGTGLGLAIVHEIAKSHYAEISVTAAHPRPAMPGQGQGALFTVRFPLRPAAAAAAAASA
jgi:two-component system sensor histidine kinase TctE